MRHLIFLTVIFFGSLSHAANTQILKCRVQNNDWSATFVLDAIGAGFLTFSKAPSTQTYTCALKLEFIKDGQKDVVPHFSTDFSRLACDPELGDLEQEILKDLTLKVRLMDPKKPEGHVQWLRRKQPDTCIVEKLNVFDVSMNAKKWSEGKWGRGTASEAAPKKVKK